MNNIITLPKLIELLSRASSQDKSLCEKFIKTFTSGVGDTLAAGEALKLKGFGLFRLEVVDGIRRVVFIPDKEMSEAINSPFACFEPVELAPGVTEEILSNDEADENGDVILNSETIETTILEEEEVLEVDSEEAYSDLTSESESEESESVAHEAEDESGEDLTDAGVGTEISENAHIEVDLKSDESEEEVSETEAVPAESGNDTAESEHESKEGNDVESGIKPPVLSFSEKETSEGEEKYDSGVVSDEISSQSPPEEPILESGDKYPDQVSDATEKEDSGKARGFSWFWVAVAYIAGMVIGFSLGFFGHGYIVGMSDKEPLIDLTGSTDEKDYENEIIDLTASEEILVDTLAESVEPPVDTMTTIVRTDTAVAVESSVTAQQEPQKPKEPVYDVVTPNRYLTKMAVEHYGNKVFWVYIYLENQSKIKDPNNVMVGTRLLIPAKEKYDVSPTDENANIEAAKRKQTEIYNRFRNN